MGGAYLVAEMNGAMCHDRIAAFRVIPYEARHSIQIPTNIHKLIDLSKEALNKLIHDLPNKPSKPYRGPDLQFGKMCLRTIAEDSDSESESEDEETGEVKGLEWEPEPETVPKGPRRSVRVRV